VNDQALTPFFRVVTGAGRAAGALDPALVVDGWAVGVVGRVVGETGLEPAGVVPAGPADVDSRVGGAETPCEQAGASASTTRAT